MENNKEVKNIADHQEQHHAEAPPPQEYISKGADNPLQPPQLQQLPAGGAMESEEGESKERPKTKQDYNWNPERCCCWGPGRFHRVMENNYECCCTNVFLICLCMAMVICCCRNGCRDSLY